MDTAINTAPLDRRQVIGKGIDKQQTTAFKDGHPIDCCTTNAPHTTQNTFTAAPPTQHTTQNTDTSTLQPCQPW
jgi:hypothetical protein